MRETVPGPRVESGGNGGLNKQENPSWAPGEDGQFTLGSAEERCREGASHIAALARQSRQSNAYSLGTIASLVGKEVPYVSKCLDVDDPHAALLMVAAVILLDKDRSFVRGLALASGCDIVVRPRLTAEQKLERLEAYLRKRGKVGEMEIAEAYGENEP